ncbi:hypothetical protein A3D00_05520 [Candidatus Woesebacteria bacterium RIFCSPHIGHO2_02_FULL_38_9]|uniref:DUF2283 domain-containing protein n=1 Tax=Candidatus Woesebacteria bacterium RIFCSPHIGHO2_01_FULL_39_28 TaxID=1802496 RepID=A0A1F7YIR2_9BACT|nr:MAG: hypothetical protein A2627_05900 [Candidatus Woesebacteria bacterium RIFCSPHIGHO2_01_FULL_39_28]OGM32014.1 MAG: hypothetical protein A3D00_05520 [Candidatus Woesebacteria bacterium RIFCSPHIGHO2_02_FULL_38_9]OGM57121.1 MAG: hypothetical protein A3A50_00310 [Candidatus Woesebacteria bacterium RIFCSPLOWO2_01_FULL_38_20]
MKVQYSNNDDILTIQLQRGKIDDAYETENMIVHVDKNNQPILLDIFNATKFLRNLDKSLPENVKQRVFL